MAHSTMRRENRSILHAESAVPGDVNLVLLYRYMISTLELLQALHKVASGVASRHTITGKVLTTLLDIEDSTGYTDSAQKNGQKVQYNRGAMMPKTMSVTEARDNFPALVRQVAGRDEPVVVTSRNEPQVVIVRWETFKHEQTLQAEGARYRLDTLVNQMKQLVSELREAYAPDSLDLSQGTSDLMILARQAWLVCRSLDKQRRHLSSALADGLLNLVEEGRGLTLDQLDRVLDILPLLGKGDLIADEVAEADMALAKAGIDSIFNIDEELASKYETEADGPVL
ncbi:MAG: type II toxin-antitoxin system prevent-host-death family antitoxin [Anaerolineales bacterium]|nr:type II toxin-antitoxin system prevent-host-death family antitoxin [Anaerolineales bacterium]